MKSIFFVYSNIGDPEGGCIEGIVANTELAQEIMMFVAKRDYEEEKKYKDECDDEPLPFEEYLHQNFLIAEKQLLESEQDLKTVTIYSIKIDLATGEVVSTRSYIDSTLKRITETPCFSTRNATDSNWQLNKIWSCGNTVEEAVIRAKGWLKTQLDNYPEDAIKPHASLLY